ncbi:hypothetical protein QAD02_020073 [Eretmocerus hayati]|uniref:Uncharacterized protein n=1 Tax=Eretmocerus hayati TaxID=131215 RepID=A0ACC2PNA5_9HYME|nr:hypothetical protein QAD02_020073 [Eretmocerus hayati]
MTMAAETENNGPAAETKDIKDVKEMKDALKDEAPQAKDNKQDEASNEKKELQAEAEKKGAGDAQAAAATDKPADASAAQAQAAAAPPQPKAPAVHKPNFDKDVVYLYQFPRTPLLPSLSSYCLKVETWLRLNGIKYEFDYARCSFFDSAHIEDVYKGRVTQRGSRTIRRYSYSRNEDAAGSLDSTHQRATLTVGQRTGQRQNSTLEIDRERQASPDKRTGSDGR